jgi:ribosome maturation factor RimP
VHGVEVAQALRDRLAPAVGASGFDLEDVVVTAAGRRRLVRVVVDKDGGVSLDECAEVSRLVSTELDADDSLLGPGPYTLEVSSPGVSRPLREPRHWRRNRGRTVKVARTDGSTLLGRLVDSDDVSAIVRPEGGDEVVVPFDQVTKATVQVELRKDADRERAG